MMMIVPILLGVALIQSTSLPSKTWKERNHPDMPAIPSCELGSGSVAAKAIKELPEQVAAELARFFDPEGGLSEAGGRYNGTDVRDGPVPTRRFLRAYQAQEYWVVWYERGGDMASGPRTIAMKRDITSQGQASDFRMTSGTAFSGDLCAATKAIFVGVRSAKP